jgi:hypothetical protein
MPGTPTTRLSIPTISGSVDDVSAYPAANLAQMEIVDNAAVYLSGTLAARAGLSGLVAGTFYYATDTAALYFYNGTAWALLPAETNAWQNITYGSSINTLQVSQTRVAGSSVFIRGGFKNVGGATITAGSGFATVAAAAVPTAAPVFLVGAAVVGTAWSQATLQVETGSGTLMCLSNDLATGAEIFISSTVYRID